MTASLTRKRKWRTSLNPVGISLFDLPFTSNTMTRANTMCFVLYQLKISQLVINTCTIMVIFCLQAKVHKVLYCFSYTLKEIISQTD